MRKCYILLFLGLTLSFASRNVNAQLADGSYAPDFTMTDYLGTSYTLYDYLTAQKPVILDVSAVWCSPCWSYHNSGALESLYNSYGPTGTNELMVMWIEGDEGTLAQLQGATGSQGNWTTGVTFPMFLTIAPNNTQVVSDYGITYFPTVYRICPNRTVTEVGQLTAASLKTACDQCPAMPTTTNDVKMFNLIAPRITYCSSTITPKVTIQNYGSASLTGLTITSKIDGVVVGTPYTWAGTLGQFDINEVTLPAITGVADGNHTFTTVASLPNGVADEDHANDSLTSSFAVNSTGANVLVRIKTDGYASEASWKIFIMGTTTVVASNADLSYGINSDYVCIPNEACYTFTMYDSYGDGMNYNGQTGSILVSLAGDTLVSFKGNDYTFNKSVGFCVGSSSIGEKAAVSSMSVYPNPFSTKANINVNLTEAQDVTINVYNLMGQAVYQVPTSRLEAGEHIFEFNGNDLSNGVYIVRMNVGDKVLTNRIELNH